MREDISMYTKTDICTHRSVFVCRWMFCSCSRRHEEERRTENMFLLMRSWPGTGAVEWNSTSYGGSWLRLSASFRPCWICLQLLFLKEEIWRRYKHFSRPTQLRYLLFFQPYIPAFGPACVRGLFKDVHFFSLMLGSPRRAKPSLWRFRDHAQTHLLELSKSDRPVAEIFTWQHATLATERDPCRRRDSNPQY